MTKTPPPMPEPSKSDRKRADLVERMADHLLAHGMSAASLRPLAQAVGTSDRMLLYYFEDKADLLSAILAAIAGRLMVELQARTSPHPQPVAALKQELAAIIMADELWPYLSLFIEIAGLSARGDPFYRQVSEHMGRGFLAWGAAQLACRDDQRDEQAAQLLVMTEGILFLKSIGMADVAARAV